MNDENGVSAKKAFHGRFFSVARFFRNSNDRVLCHLALESSHEP